MLLLGGLVGSAPRVVCAADGARAAGAGLRIAIAPFAGEGEDEAVSQLLSVRFARLGVERLLAPGSFVADREFDPRADAVRTWAYQAAVDTIVVGRVERFAKPSGAQQIEAVARSGHSGAELFRHAVHVSERAGLGSALDRLAAAFVRDLGGDPLAEVAGISDPPTPAVSAKAESGTPVPAVKGGADGAGAAKPAGSGESVAAAKTESGDVKKDGPSQSEALKSRMGMGEFNRDAPIEIKADQAEIMAQGTDRKLVFQGGVWVRQDNVTLTSDLLEAEYAEGESEPSRLVARGNVHAEQGNRSAHCDRAEYLRVTGKLTCRGHAQLVQGCDVVRGEMIELDLTGNRARVEGAASIVINPKQNADSSCAVSRPGS